jgi:uncharacterized protein
MLIQGKYHIDASIQEVWKHLMDPMVLKRITPGISELTPVGDDKYKAISRIKVGPINGRFEGELEIRNKTEDKAATLVIDQNSKIGNASAEIKMQLHTVDGGTEIEYNGDAKLSGKIAMMGQRVIGGVIRSLSKQFFAALNHEINS